MKFAVIAALIAAVFSMVVADGPTDSSRESYCMDNSIYYTDTGRLFQNCGDSKCVQKVSKPDHRCDSNSTNSTSRVHFHAYCDPPLRLPGVNCIELKEIPKKQSWCSVDGNAYVYSIIPTPCNGWKTVMQMCGGYDTRCVEEISDFDGAWRAKCDGR